LIKKDQGKHDPLKRIRDNKGLTLQQESDYFGAY